MIDQIKNFLEENKVTKVMIVKSIMTSLCFSTLTVMVFTLLRSFMYELFISSNCAVVFTFSQSTILSIIRYYCIGIFLGPTFYFVAISIHKNGLNKSFELSLLKELFIFVCAFLSIAFLYRQFYFGQCEGVIHASSIPINLSLILSVIIMIIIIKFKKWGALIKLYRNRN